MESSLTSTTTTSSGSSPKSSVDSVHVNGVSHTSNDVNGNDNTNISHVDISTDVNALRNCSSSKLNSLDRAELLCYVKKLAIQVKLSRDKCNKLTVAYQKQHVDAETQLEQERKRKSKLKGETHVNAVTAVATSAAAVAEDTVSVESDSDSDAEITKLKAMVLKMKKLLIQKNSIITDSSSKYDTLVIETKERCEEITAKLEATLKDSKQFETQLSNANEHIEKLELDNEILKISLARAESTSKNDRIESAECIASMRLELEKCTSELEEFQIGKLSLDHTIAEKDTELLRLSDEIQGLNSELLCAKAAISTENSRVDASSGDSLTDNIENVTTVDSEISLSDRKLSSSSTGEFKCSVAEVENQESLRIATFQLIHERDSALKDLADIRSKCDELVAQVANADKAADQIGALNDKFCQASEELVLMRKELDVSNEIIKTTKQRAIDTENSLMKSTATSDALQLQIADRDIELERVNVQLQRLHDELHECSTELDLANKKLNSGSMVALELADCQTINQDLNKQLIECTSRCADLEKAQIVITADLSATNEASTIANSKITELSLQINLLNIEIESNRNDAASAAEAASIQEHYVKKLEGMLDESKIEMAQFTATSDQTNAELATTARTMQRAAESAKAAEQEALDQLCELRAALERVTAEFKAFKVRAHTVLKQHREKTSPSADSVELLNAELITLRDQLTTVRTEKEEITAAMSALQKQFNLVMDKNRVETNEHTKAMAAVQLEVTTLQQEVQDTVTRTDGILERNRSEHASVVSELQLQLQQQQDKVNAIEAVKKYESEIHRNDMALLQQRVRDLNADVLAEKELLRKSMNTACSSLTSPNDDGSGFGNRGLAGKSMPISSHSSLSSLSGLTSDINKCAVGVRMSEDLQRLLSGPSSNGGTTLPIGHTSTDISRADFEQKTRQLGNLAELLRESETANHQLIEQTKLLKDEIRRIERNILREETVNLEYLKNVVMEFLNEPNEKEQLIPVLSTLLQLSPSETMMLKSRREFRSSDRVEVAVKSLNVTSVFDSFFG